MLQQASGAGLEIPYKAEKPTTLVMLVPDFLYPASTHAFM